VVSLQVVGTPGELPECLARIDSLWGHPHESPEQQVTRGSNAVRERGNAINLYAAARCTCSRPSTSARTQVHLDERADVTASRSGSPVKGDDQPVPVDRVNGVGIGRHRARLVGLKLTDEVDMKKPTNLCRQSRDLGRRLLVAVLPDVCDAELAEQLDVSARKELCDHDQLNIRTGAPCCHTRGTDAVLDMRETG